MGKGKKGVRKGRDSAPAAASKKEERAAKKQLKKRFGDKEERDFEVQLQALGGTIAHMASDGNCLFRSINDQLEGKPEKHMECRRKIVEYMEAHPDHYSPFVEDDEPWDDYVPRMKREREWGGQLEIVAASRLFQVNIVVHQLNAPRLEVHADNAKRTIHLSYHGESHYNSVRAATDLCRPGEPAQQWVGVASVATPPAPAPTPAASNGEGNGKKEKGSGKKKKGAQQQYQQQQDGKDGGEDQKGDGKEAAAAAAPALDGVRGDGDGDGEEGPAAEPATESQPEQGGGGDAEAEEEEDGDVANGGDVDAAVEKEEAAKATGGQCPCGSGRKYRKCCRKADRQRQRLGGGGAAGRKHGGGLDDEEEEEKGAAASKQHKKKKQPPPVPPSSDPVVDAVAAKLEAIAM